MPGTTPAYGFPYPTGTDRVMDGDNAIAALAQAVEDRMAGAPLPWRMAAGIAATWANIAANAGASQAVTFPVGRFTQAPIMACNAISSGYLATSTATPTTSGVTLRCYNPTGGSITPASVQWQAVQMLPGAAPGLREAEPEPAYVVTCRTAGCGNEGEAIPVAWDADVDGPELRAACGVCGEPIAEVRAA